MVPVALLNVAAGAVYFWVRPQQHQPYWVSLVITVAVTAALAAWECSCANAVSWSGRCASGPNAPRPSSGSSPNRLGTPNAAASLAGADLGGVAKAAATNRAMLARGVRASCTPAPRRVITIRAGAACSPAEQAVERIGRLLWVGHRRESQRTVEGEQLPETGLSDLSGAHTLHHQQQRAQHCHPPRRGVCWPSCANARAPSPDAPNSANVSGSSTPWPISATGKDTARARYRGSRKNQFDLRRTAVVHNLHVIARQPDHGNHAAA